MVEAVYWILMTIGYYRIIGCDRVISREISPLVSRCFHQSIHGRLAPGTLTLALQGGSIKADHAEKTHENTWNAENKNVDSEWFAFLYPQTTYLIWVNGLCYRVPCKYLPHIPTWWPETVSLWKYVLREPFAFDVRLQAPKILSPPTFTRHPGWKKTIVWTLLFSAMFHLAQSKFTRNRPTVKAC